MCVGMHADMQSMCVHMRADADWDSPLNGRGLMLNGRGRMLNGRGTAQWGRAHHWGGLQLDMPNDRPVLCEHDDAARQRPAHARQRVETEVQRAGPPGTARDGGQCSENRSKYKRA